MKQIKKLIILLALAFTLVSVSTASALRNGSLRGEMELYFMAGGPDIGYGPPVWSGTIAGDINGEMYFYNTGSKDVGQAHFFWEVWYITTANGDLIGIDHGVVSWKNNKYRMNGVVEEATGDLAYLEGRNVHMSGIITWQNIGTPEEPVMIPETAPGVFRVN